MTIYQNFGQKINFYLSEVKFLQILPKLAKHFNFSFKFHK